MISGVSRVSVQVPAYLRAVALGRPKAEIKPLDTEISVETPMIPTRSPCSSSAGVVVVMARNRVPSLRCSPNSSAQPLPSRDRATVYMTNRRFRESVCNRV